MPIYNNTSKVLPYSSGQMTGVILPRSDKVLTAEDLDQRIATAKGHIEHLTAQLPHRQTHGGPGFRSKVTSLRDQIDQTSKRLNLLQTAKAAIPQVRYMGRGGWLAGISPIGPSPMTY